MNWQGRHIRGRPNGGKSGPLRFDSAGQTHDTPFRPRSCGCFGFRWGTQVGATGSVCLFPSAHTSSSKFAFLASRVNVVVRDFRVVVSVLFYPCRVVLVDAIGINRARSEAVLHYDFV